MLKWIAVGAVVWWAMPRRKRRVVKKAARKVRALLPA